MKESGRNAMMRMQQERDMANKFILSILKHKCHRETCGTLHYLVYDKDVSGRF